MGIFSWLRRRRSPRSTRLNPDELETFRKHIHEQAESGGKEPILLTHFDEVASLHIAELIRIGREKVCILGDLLPAEVFLSAPVRAAMDGLFSRNPAAQVVVATNDPTYTREALSAFDEPLLDVSRVKIMPLSGLVYPPGMPFRFVLSDSKEAPSYWFNEPGANARSWTGFTTFRSPEFGAKLKVIFDHQVIGHAVSRNVA